MDRRKRILVVVLSMLASFGGMAVAVMTRKQPTPSPTAELQPVPEFRLTERSGTALSHTDLRGKVWIASFVFTRCSGTCPAVAATLARLQGDLADVPDARLVTFTIDPDRDTPDELTKYAERYRADPNRWLFLTGPEAEVHKLATNGFRVLAKRNPDGRPGDEFDHGTYLVLVDKQGMIRDYIPGIPPKSGPPEAYEDGLKELVATVKRLASE